MVMCKIQEAPERYGNRVEIMPGVLVYEPKNVTPEEQAAAVQRKDQRLAALRVKWGMEQKQWAKK